jgi:predicted 3-demethylubiquinone-9 3-methyltransferase (glyoxalase superfamily)
MQKITPNLWFDDNAEEAVDLMSGPDEQAADRAVQCMLGMVKLDTAAIRRAYEGG